MFGIWLAIIYGAGIIGIIFAFVLVRQVLSSDKGTPEMQRIAGLIFQGAMAFLRRQYTTIAYLAIVAAILIGIVLALLPANVTDTINNPHPISGFDLGWHTSLAFLLGAFCSGLSGFIGMYVAVQSNLRTAAAAQRGLGDALKTSLRGGAVSGFLVVSLSLLGVTTILLAYGGLNFGNNPTSNDVINIVSSVVGFGFGASFVALFAQLGGGIYTKAADVGADLVGKVEAGIPEDDPRNPAVIADLVGDNVGDCAGRGADLFESMSAENIGAIVLGAGLYASSYQAHHPQIAWIMFPLVVNAFGLIASLIGLLSVRSSDRPHDPMNDLNLGFYVTAVLAAIGMFGTTYFMFGDSGAGYPADAPWKLGLAGLIGIAVSFAFVFITQYYTSGSWRPVREIANASQTGPATVVIAGTAVGFETTAAPTIVICLALIGAYGLGNSITLPDGTTLGIFGTAVATLGMLMSAGYILAMDTFGPITDNAGGIVEMSEAPENIRNVTDALDSVGNTTKALTKGYAVGSAALAAFLLFSAYIEKAGLNRYVSPTTNALANAPKTSFVNLADPIVFAGGFIGAMLVFLFSSLSVRAVGRAAGGMIDEVRRQFRADPGIMKGTSNPDYARCVDISTRSALRQMIAPGVLAVGTPILVGLILRAQAAAGMLMIGTIVGVLMANYLNNAGGAWDNAKKWIEAGNLKDSSGKVLGKRTDAHAAAVVGDTVGDPFKDTSGPSLHVLIKLLATITLVLAPLFI